MIRDMKKYIENVDDLYSEKDYCMIRDIYIYMQEF